MKLHTLGLAAALVLAGAAQAQTAERSAQAAYQQERAACMQGNTTNADRATCLREAAAAYAEARRGRLSNGVSDAQKRENALLRCQQQPASERADCERMARGEGKVSGSVAEGAVVKELVTRTVEPAAAGSAPAR
jgi:long-subunit fatty acid transport protein